ncbi:MAG: hypothetical protein GY835_22040 [bacterium]|nr:hypothetical protein [bacterium]
MKTRLFDLLAVLLLALVLSAVFGQAAQARDFTNQADIIVQGGPLHDGKLTFNYQIKDGIDIEIWVEVKSGSTREHVAEQVRNALDHKVGANAEVKSDGKRKVTVTKLRDAPRFALTWTGGGTGVRISIDYD